MNIKDGYFNSEPFNEEKIHIDAADDFAKAIIANFDYHEQNEILDRIKNVLIENRMERRAVLGKDLEEINEMLSALKP